MLQKERLRLDTRKFYSSQRVVNGWNRIPATVVTRECRDYQSVSAFKNLFIYLLKCLRSLL